MSVFLAPDGQVRLSGMVSLHEAEHLLRMLIDNPGAEVDWRACQACHSAALQVLLAARRKMIGPPDSDFLRNWTDLN